MIVDRFENIRNYAPLLKNLEASLAKMAEYYTNDLSEIPNGHYEFEGGFFNVMEGESHAMEDGQYEFHRNYIDVQIAVSGGETMAWETADKLTLTQAYDADKDIGFMNGPKDHLVQITPGMFYAVFPQDMHEPSGHSEKAHYFKKIVLKLPVC